MQLIFLGVAVVTLACAAAAMTLRNLVHCALCAAGAFAGLAAAYLLLNAEFIAFAQLLVYVGAVAILIVVALLLTRNLGAPNGARAARPWVLGIGVAWLVLGGMVSALVGSGWGGAAATAGTQAAPAPAVKDIGVALMTRYVVALEIVGLLLTAALIGAAVLAFREREI